MCRSTFSIFNLIILGLLASSVFAQTQRFVVIQDVNENVADPCELASQGSLTINPASGDISITVNELQDCLGSALALDVSELFLSPSSVIAGTSFTIVWASVGPVEDAVPGYACTATDGGSNPLPGWLGTPIGLSGPTTVNVAGSTTTGLYDLGISCSIPDDPEATVSRSAQIQVSQQAIDPPPQPTLTVNGVSTSTSVDQGDSVSIAWSSQNATSCTASGTFPGWSGTQALSGTQVFNDTSQVALGSYTISIRCSNSGGQSPLASVGVSVLDPDDPPPSECSTRPLLGVGTLNNWVRKTTGGNSCKWEGFSLDTNADCRFFDQVWPSAWPSNSTRVDLLIDGNGGREFIALEFNSGNIPPSVEGSLQQEVPQFGGASSATKIWSISKCPGDFNKALVDAEMGPGCIREDQFGVTQSFEWGGANSETAADRCGLQPNTRYFLNIVFTQDDAGTPPDQIEPHFRCESDRCGVPITISGSYTP
jgi:hypothetical protein